MLRCLGACTAGGEGCWSPVGILVRWDDAGAPGMMVPSRDAGSSKGCWFPKMMLVPQDDAGPRRDTGPREGCWSPRGMLVPQDAAGPLGCCWYPERAASRDTRYLAMWAFAHTLSSRPPVGWL